MRAPLVAAVGLAALGLALAACGVDEDGEAGPDQTPDANGTVAQCVVGDWRSVGVESEVGGEAAEIRVAGGSRVALTVGADGVATVDFSGMVPVSVAGQVLGVEVAGELTYDGEASGTVRTETDATSGGWTMAESVDWSGVRVTLDLTEPVQARPFEEMPIGDVIEEADEVTGELVEVDPILSEGTFQCQNDTLVLRSADDGTAWTLRRA